MLYAFTILAVASIVVTVGSAVADRADAQCRGNSPKKICPKLTPSTGETVSGDVSVVAEAPENVAGIEFRVDDAPLAPEITKPPFELTWNTRQSPDGTHTLSATARDDKGNSSTRESIVTVSNASVDTTSPSVEFSSPVDGATLSGNATVAANASDNVGVVGVQFKVDGANLESEDTTAPYSVTWDTTKTSNTSHTLTAVARDAAGNTVAAERSVKSSNTAPPPGSTTPPPGDTTSPSVELTSPQAGATVSGQVTVAANATDNVGVVGVQFRLDGVNMGSEDTSAPYSASWDTTKTSNAGHTVTAVARDAAGNTSSAQRTVSVSNSTSDTTAPAVQLMSPEVGEAVSGSTTVVANASDNVAVAGVQFKLDGANLASEDTTAPYAADWDTTKTSNGSHTLTAVARDAAGNSSSSQRTVSVSNSSAGPTLSWAPPTLSNPISMNVSNANRRLYLDNSRDYRLNIVEPLKKELWIEGGRNVVVVGGQITIDQLGDASSYQDNTAVKVRFGDPAGTVHLEGLLIEGPYVNDGIAIATGRNVQIQNVRIARAYDNIKGGHADCVQIQQGVGHLRMDRFTCTTERQGIFLGDHAGPIGSADLRHVNMYAAGGVHLLWQTNPTYPVALSDFWLAIAPGYSPWAPFGYWVYPQKDGRTCLGQIDRRRRAVISGDGKRLWFVSSRIKGLVRKGHPPAGEFVPTGVAGMVYVSPGYGSRSGRRQS